MCAVERAYVCARACHRRLDLLEHPHGCVYVRVCLCVSLCACVCPKRLVLLEHLPVL